MQLNMCEKPPFDVNLWDMNNFIRASSESGCYTIAWKLNIRIPQIADKHLLNKKLSGCRAYKSNIYLLINPGKSIYLHLSILG